MDDNAMDSPRQYVEEIRAALNQYVALGWCALPADAVRKHPAVPWRQYQSRRPAPKEVLELFRRAWRRLNLGLGIGLVTGAASGLLVLDLDASKNGQPAGWESLADKLADLPPGPVVLTPSGGRHYYFRLPEGAIPPRNAAGKLPGVDWRGEGGWVVAPPTRRPDGGRYEWAPECGPNTPLPEPPGWLLALIREHGGGGSGPGRNPKNWQTEAVAALRMEGSRNDAIARLAGWFCTKGFPQEAAAALLQAASTLPAEEVAATVDSIYAGHHQRHPTPARDLKAALADVLAAWRGGRLTRPEAALALVEMGFGAQEIRALLERGGT